MIGGKTQLTKKCYNYKDRMSHQYKIGLSKQAIDVYQLLLDQGSFSATDIGKRLKLAPTAVYRLVDHLIFLGIITASATRPALYSAKDPSLAREQYIAAQRAWFTDSVVGNFMISQMSQTSEQMTDAAFITGRNAIFSRITKDYHMVKRSIIMIILGLSEGISPELLLAQKDAVEKGVRCKIIVQEYRAENRDTITSWIQNGAVVRHGKPIGFHMVILDDRISYLMWYDEHDRSKRTAVRFVHAGIAKQLQAVFDGFWRDAIPIHIS